jgi:CxxC motif-containing protein (DUF1111 family)
MSQLRDGLLAGLILIALPLGNLPAPLPLPLPVPGEPPVSAVDPGIRPGTGGLGGVIAGVSAGERQVWRDGRDLFFSRTCAIDEGLGPRFNFSSCLGCHSQPAVGGTSAALNPQAFVSLDFPGNTRHYSFIREDGPTREARVVRKPDGTPDGGVHALFTIGGAAGADGCSIQQEDLDAQLAAHNLVFRIPTPVFGAGLIENIRDAAILENMAANAPMKQYLGIIGHPNRVTGDTNRNGNDGTITRFGWKAQNKSLELFAGEAMNVEQGISNDLFPMEREETATCQFRTAQNDFEPVDGVMPFTVERQTQLRSAWRHMTFTMRFHKQPSPVASFGEVPPASILRGETMFAQVGCALCHTPQLMTSPTAQSPALRNQPVRLFSDLLLHDMGEGLADGVIQGEAGPREFRTAPLWGVGQRIFLLHDGRTKDIVQAVLQHSSEGSEATKVVENFKRLSPQAQQDLVNFLRAQ